MNFFWTAVRSGICDFLYFCLYRIYRIVCHKSRTILGRRQRTVWRAQKRQLAVGNGEVILGSEKPQGFKTPWATKSEPDRMKGLRDARASCCVIGVAGFTRRFIERRSADGNVLLRHSIWIAHAGEESRVRGDRDSDAGAGDWRQYRAIFGGQRSVAESASLPAGQSDRCDWREQGEFCERIGFVSEFSRLAEGKSHFFFNRCLSAAAIQSYGNRRCGTDPRPIYFVRLFFAARRESGDRQNIC